MRSCKSNEESRLAMDRDQIPRQRNFTELGFAKIIAPKVVYEAARNFWDLHKETLTSEAWPAGNTYVNHWVAQSRMCSFEDHRLQPLGLRTKDKIWNGAKPILEAWTGQELKPTSLYVRRADLPLMNRGAAAAADADIPWRRVATPPRPRRGSIRGDESTPRPRRGYFPDESRRGDADLSEETSRGGRPRRGRSAETRVATTRCDVDISVATRVAATRT